MLIGLMVGMGMASWAAPVGPQKTVFYYPSSGDTLVKISEKYYGTADYAVQLGSVNNVVDVTAHLSGMAVKVPTLAELFALSPATESVTTTLAPVTTTLPVVTTTLAPVITTLTPVTTTLAPTTTLKQVGPPKTIYHYTSSGDTLVKISKKYYGTADYAPQLAKLNNIKGIKRRLSGKVITVPPRSELK